MVLSRQGLTTGKGLPFTASRIAGIRERASIPAARARPEGSDGLTIRAAANELGGSTQTIRRWFRKACYRPSRPPRTHRGGSA